MPYLERIAQILQEDKTLPKKQRRHTAKRIYERLRGMGYGGKYTQVKEAVRELLRVKQEVFMPLVHRVGEAQVDFGYALVKVSIHAHSRDAILQFLVPRFSWRNTTFQLDGRKHLRLVKAAQPDLSAYGHLLSKGGGR